MREWVITTYGIKMWEYANYLDSTLYGVLYEYYQESLDKFFKRKKNLDSLNSQEKKGR